jgi:NAD(P)H dehydrogenase (quinone)
LIVFDALNTLLRPLLRGAFYYVGYDVLPPFIAWHVPYVSDSVRRRYLDQLGDYLGRLDDLAPLSFPRMDQFDDRLFPIAARSP